MTKSTIPRKQLIKKAQEQIEFCRHTKITGEGRAHVNQCAALFEIALAAMDSEPVAWTSEEAIAEVYCDETAMMGPKHMMGDVALYRHAQPAPDGEQLAIENFRSAMEGIGHIRRTLEETFGGLHGTHVEPDVLAECKAICDAIYAAYGRAPVAVTDDELNAALQLHRLKVDGHSQLSDSFRAGFRYARRTTPQPASVVPDAYVRDERGRMMLNGVCEPKIGFSAGWNACRAAMLAAAPHNTPTLNSLQSVDSVADRWIPVSERMPENDGAYLCWDKRYVTTYAFIFGAWQANQFIAKNITHWMPLPAAPQEVKGE